MIAETSLGVILDVRIIPRAAKPGIAGVRDNALLLRLAAPPVAGAANAELIERLAKALDVPKQSIAIITGDKNRRKRVRITGLTPGAVRQRLGISELA